MSEPEATSGRGRPRPQSTIERDEKVLAFIAGAEQPVNRKQIVEGTEIPGNEVYLSLYRLRRDAKIVREGNVWKAASAEATAA